MDEGRRVQLYFHPLACPLCGRADCLLACAPDRPREPWEDDTFRPLAICWEREPDLGEACQGGSSGERCGCGSQRARLPGFTGAWAWVGPEVPHGRGATSFRVVVPALVDATGWARTPLHARREVEWVLHRACRKVPNLSVEVSLDGLNWTTKLKLRDRSSEQRGAVEVGAKPVDAVEAAARSALSKVKSAATVLLRVPAEVLLEARGRVLSGVGRAAQPGSLAALARTHLVRVY